MERGTYKVTLEFNVLKDIKRETFETFLKTVMDRSGSIVFLNMSTPIAADSDQAKLEAILVEAIRDNDLGEQLSQFYTGVNSAKRRPKSRNNGKK